MTARNSPSELLLFALEPGLKPAFLIASVHHHLRSPPYLVAAIRTDHKMWVKGCNLDFIFYVDVRRYTFDVLR